MSYEDETDLVRELLRDLCAMSGCAAMAGRTGDFWGVTYAVIKIADAALAEEAGRPK